MDGDLRIGMNVHGLGTGQLMAGFDFPIGVPRAYGERAGITFFPDFLPLIGHEPWHRFAEVAERAHEVSIHRPFYPARPGGTLQSHLYDGLGLSRQQIRRRSDGNDAETIFWTLGGKQVGKAALAGWEYLSAVRPESVRLWPFQGPLTALLDGGPDTVVVTETYPREFYQHFRSGTSGSKTKQEDRLQWIPSLFRWADGLGVSWGTEVVGRVEAGFSADINGEDEFDAVVGLLGMISVVTGAIESGEPRDDSAVINVEGWILGRRATRWDPPLERWLPNEQGLPIKREVPIDPQVPPLPMITADHDEPPESGQSSKPEATGDLRAPLEATFAGLITIARTVGYSDDDLIDLFQRVLLKGT
jgi:hypothetical protein